MPNKDIQIKTFNGGMNKDVDYSILPENVYTHSENYKLIADKDSNSFTLETAEGNYTWLNLSDVVGNDYFIAGHCYISKYLVLFVTKNETETTPTSKPSKIVRIRVGGDLKQQVSTIYTDSFALGRLNFSVTHPIKAVGVYENDDIIKVYWVDGYNEDRFINIMDPSLSTKKVNIFSMVPDFPDVASIPYGDKDVRVNFIDYISGNITASKIEYTYQYYNLNGAATKFAPVSPPIPIGIGNPDSNAARTYRGGEVDENTGHGCRLSINTPSVKTYDRIRLVALDYNNIVDVPVVRVFGEFEIDSSNTDTILYFNDIGNTINELLFEDFLVYGNSIYTSKDIETKNNILFKANLKETVFDIDYDARVYRHNSSGIARLYDVDLSTYIQVDGGSSYLDYDEVPENHDCINLYNNPDYEDNASYQYKFQANGTTWGAEGEKMKISFATKQLIVDNLGVGTGYVSSFAPDVNHNPADPYNVAYNKSLQRHEVYRLGIVLFNKKFQNTPVKWMCDLKMPNHSDNSSAYQFSSLSSTDTEANLLGLTVTMIEKPTDDDFYAWQVVAVKRDSLDNRSVVLNGIVQTPWDNTTNCYPLSAGVMSNEEDMHGSATYVEQLMLLISPEINFNQNAQYYSNSFIQYNGSFDYTSDNRQEVVSGLYTAHKLNDFTGSGTYTTAAHVSTISDFKIVSQGISDEEEISIGSYVYKNYASGVSGNSESGLHGTVGIAYSSSPIDPNTADAIAYVSYRRNIFQSQYGGLSYYDRQRNEYVGVSTIRYSTSSPNQIITYEGDTNIEFYYYNKQAFDLVAPDTSMYSSVLFPVETSIILGLRHDETIIKNVSQLLQREISGTFSVDNVASTTTDLYYVQEKDAYQYNSVYSLLPSGNVYFDTLFDQSNQTSFPIRVIHSDTKLNGELQDSFTIFRVNNFIDVDGSHGQINNLLNFNNTLYFWQDSGFGILSVDTRSLIQDNNPGILAVGTGGVLDRYDYLSTVVGNQNPYGIVASNKYIYWIDINKNEIYKFTGKDVPISKTNGLQTWLNEKGKLGWVIGVYDYKYNDVIFTMSFSRLATKLPSANAYSLDSLSGLNNTGTIYYNAVIDGKYTSTLYDGKNNVIYNNVNTTYIDNEMSPTPSSGDKFYFDIKNDPINTYTVSYSEQIESFVSFLSYTPSRYIGLDNAFLSTQDNVHLYKHNDPSATRATYYGTTYDSIIETVFNKDYAVTKVFDVIKWISDSRNSDNINIFKNTFSEVSISNDYQHTGNRTLYFQHDAVPATRPTPLSRRERTWSMQVPRNIVDSSVDTNPDITDTGNWDDSQTKKDRIRDKYIHVKLTYDNSDGYKFSVPFISTIYRKSFR